MTRRYQIDDLRIVAMKEVAAPETLHADIPASDAATTLINSARQAIHRILSAEDDRLLVIVGPCSIHDPQAATEYAKRLATLREQYADSLEIVMRVYFEKPRTTVGWKGLINDPGLDGSFHINQGLRLGRTLLRDLNELGVPAATEFLDLITPQYIADLISWGAIGARTTESQVHRELASGLSCPVGFKNGTDGNLGIAVDAINAASRQHVFLSLTKEGRSAIFQTTGNPDCHVILRGGNGQPNYDAASVDAAASQLESKGLPARMMIDFSHANSQKQHQRQIDVGRNVAGQIAAGEDRIIGAMIESHLVAGRQDVVAGQELTYGQSITDACIAWDDTEPLLAELANAVQQRRALAAQAANA